MTLLLDNTLQRSLNYCLNGPNNTNQLKHNGFSEIKRTYSAYRAGQM
jgi:hypothetical protein